MSSPIVQLLGEFLLEGTTKVNTADKMADVDAVGIYFSAHWCGPCRGFTPQLAKAYTQMKAAGKKFEVVFASSDQGQEAFDSYHAEMPWLAIDYADRAKKDALSKKYKVSGIPSFVIVDAKTGELITTDGRSAITSDPTGESFPWKPKSLDEIMGSITTLAVAGQDGATVERAAALEGKTVGLYFSAHWCGPCRGFTPELVKTYNAMKAEAGGNGDNFEIVFVSSDRDQEAFDSYHAEMPWLALPYSERATKEELSKALEVRGIPTFVIIGPDGKVINKDGRAALGKDPTGANFPWTPPAYTDLEDCGSINDTPTVVAFVEGCGPDAVAAAEAAIKEAAEASKAAGKDGISFAIAKKGDGLAERVRGLAPPHTVVDDKVLLMLVDLADEQTYYTAEPSDSLDAAAVSTFVEFFDSKSLERKSLEF